MIVFCFVDASFQFLAILAHTMPSDKQKEKAKFIEAVSEWPLLWDKSHDDYKNKKKVDDKWDDLASEHGFKGDLITLHNNQSICF